MLVIRPRSRIENGVLCGELAGVGSQPGVQLLGLDWNDAAIVTGRSNLGWRFIGDVVRGRARRRARVDDGRRLRSVQGVLEGAGRTLHGPARGAREPSMASLRPWGTFARKSALCGARHPRRVHLARARALSRGQSLAGRDGPGDRQTRAQAAGGARAVVGLVDAPRARCCSSWATAACALPRRPLASGRHSPGGRPTTRRRRAGCSR